MTRTLPGPTDHVVVVGAGLAGLSAALHLLGAGRRVTVVTPALIRSAHRAGRQVHVWTIDDAAEIERLLDLGVDGIFTDRPDTLKSVLQRRGLWPTGSEH